MTGAIGQALRKAAATEPAPGGTLTITYTGDGAPTRPGLSGPKQYTAEYTPPAGTAAFFNTTQNKNEKPPAGIDTDTWAAMPEAARAAIRSLKGAKVIDEPPF
jgi:hypothetical protein